jgi:hypothetical protein
VLRERARRNGARADLDRAASLLEGVSTAASGTFDDRYVAMNALGNALRNRHHATGRQTRSRSRNSGPSRRARRRTPGSAQSATLLTNLGAAQCDRYAVTRSTADLDEAAAHLRVAVEMSPPGSADKPRRLFALALAARDRYAASRQPADLDTAVDAYRRGCADGMTGDPRPPRWRQPRNGAPWASAGHRWPEAATAYRTAIAAMLSVVQAQLIREHQENWLRDAAGLPARAAYASAKAHQLPAAVAAAEAGRAAILAETLQRQRLDLRRLAGLRPDLVDRYAGAANRLRMAQQHRPTPRPGP